MATLSGIFAWKTLQTEELGWLQSKRSRRTGHVGAQYATGDQQKNNFRKNEEVEPKQKQHTAGDVTGDRNKV